MADRFCPCGTGLAYAVCCEPLHLGCATARTAIALMRSRYSAYALGRIPYLLETTHPDRRTPHLAAEMKNWCGQAEFLRLEILSTWQGEERDRVGKVEFIAHFRQQDAEQELHEISRFRRHRARWVYFDGETG